MLPRNICADGSEDCWTTRLETNGGPLVVELSAYYFEALRKDEAFMLLLLADPCVEAPFAGLCRGHSSLNLRMPFDDPLRYHLESCKA